VVNVQNPPETRKRTIQVSLVNKEALTNQGLIEMPGQTYSVTLNIKAPMSEFGQISDDQFKLTADLGTLTLGPGKRQIPVTVVEYPPDVTIVNSYLLYVTISIDNLKETTVPVKTDIKMDVKSGYTALSPVTRPTSVTVRGPAQYVNSVKYVMARDSIKDVVDADKSMSLPLRAYDEAGGLVENVTVIPSVADVTVLVKKTKSVGINVKYKGTLLKDYQVSKVELTPDKVDIAGDASVINNISVLDTEPIDYSTLNSTKTIDVKLVVPDNVTLVNSNGVVHAKITVDKIVQTNKTVDIKIDNLGSDYNASLDKSKTSVVITGVENRIGSMTADDVKCSVDLSNLGEGEFSVPVSVKSGDGLSVNSYSPQSVKVTITKKNVGSSGGNQTANNGQTTPPPPSPNTQ
jgi:YbbR domain-containing protein